MMTNTWKKITLPQTNVAVSGISSACVDNGTKVRDLWLCSPAGLFCENDGTFLTVVPGASFHGASAVLAIDKLILLAGFPNHIFQSTDSGHTWFHSRVDKIESAVTSFTASPNFSRDALLLAGTDGDGILRSTDGGSSWQASNFGLRSLNILSLVCAPAWNREVGSNSVVYNYEIAFAATETGVYMSPNAGRAWRFAGDGLPETPILSIALSPDFKRLPGPSDICHKGTLFAGTDGAGLYRSQDGSQTWQAVISIPTNATINTIFIDARGKLYLGTGEHGVLASSDQGESWETILKTDDVILCLAAHGSSLVAGTAENGLLTLDDELSSP